MDTITMDTSDQLQNNNVIYDSTPPPPPMPGNYMDIYDTVQIEKCHQQGEDERISAESHDLMAPTRNGNCEGPIGSHGNPFHHDNQLSSDFGHTDVGVNDDGIGVRTIRDVEDDGGYGELSDFDGRETGYLGDPRGIEGYNQPEDMTHTNQPEHPTDNSQSGSDGAHNMQYYANDGYQRLDENENLDTEGYQYHVNAPSPQPDHVMDGGFVNPLSGANIEQNRTTDARPEPLTEQNEAELYQAAVEGDMMAVKMLIEHGEAEEVSMISDQCGGKGRTILHAAVHARCSDVLHVLLEHGACPDVQDAEGATPLHLAVRLGYVDIVESLLSKGANVNIEDEQGRTPMQMCLNMDKEPLFSDSTIVNMLIPSTDFTICDFDGISVLHCLAYWDMWSPLETTLTLCLSAMVKDNRGRTPLHYCFMNPAQIGLDAAYILIRVDASIMIKDFDGKTPIHRLMKHPLCNKHQDVPRFIKDFICAEIKNPDGHSLLHLSTIGADVELLRFMSRCGVDMNERDREGNSPLHIAVLRNQSEMVRILLHCGADANVQDYQKQTPLHLASTQSRITAAKLLLAEGGDVDAQDERGHTSLHRSVHAGSVELTKLLLNSGGSVNAVDFNDSLPIHYAAEEAKLELVELLLLRRSKVNCMDIDGRTPLHLAVKTGNSDILRILILHGCSVNEYDRYGQTPLHMAAESGKSEVVQTLMNRGANDNLRDSEGRKPEQVAIHKGSLHVMKVMKEHRDSMILYSQENLLECSQENIVEYMSRSRSNMVACVSSQTLDDIDEREDLFEEGKPTSNGIASLAKLQSDDGNRKCVCCVVQ